MLTFKLSFPAQFFILILFSILSGRTWATASDFFNHQEELGSLEYDYYELEQIEQFREFTSEIATKDFMKTDAYIRRWLKAYEGDIEEAMNGFAKSMEWRRKNRIDGILTENFTLIEQIIPFTFEGHDKDGRPVIWSPAGTYDLRKIAIAGVNSLYQRYLIKAFEFGEDLMFDMGKENGYHNISQIVVILDVAKYNLKQVGCFKCLSLIPETLSNLELNYPLIFHKIFCINGPTIYKTMLNLVKSVSKYTKDIMESYGFDKDKWTAALLQQIPASSLPEEYGGTKPSINSPFSNKNRKDHGFPNYYKHSQQIMLEKDKVNDVKSAIRKEEIEDVLVLNSKLDYKKTNELFNSSKMQAKTNKSGTRIRHHHHHYNLRTSSRRNYKVNSKNSCVSYLALNSASFRFSLTIMLMIVIKVTVA